MDGVSAEVCEFDEAEPIRSWRKLQRRNLQKVEQNRYVAHVVAGCSKEVKDDREAEKDHSEDERIIRLSASIALSRPREEAGLTLSAQPVRGRVKSRRDAELDDGAVE